MCDRVKPDLSSMVRATTKPRSPSKAEATARKAHKRNHCGIHTSVRYSKTSETYCTKCKHMQLWADAMGFRSEYSYLLNGHRAHTYCHAHKSSLIAMHPSNMWLSFCWDCSEAQAEDITICSYFCEDHGPWPQDLVVDMKCNMCPKMCKPYPADSPEVKDELPAVDSDVNDGEPHPPDSAVVNDELSAAESDVNDSKPLAMSNSCGSIVAAATLTQLHCSLHDSLAGPVYICIDKNGDQIRVCRTCRMLYKQYAPGSIKAPTKTCNLHPQSELMWLKKIKELCCMTCARSKVVSDVVCNFHPQSSLLLDQSSGNLVKACVQCVFLENQRGKILRLQDPDSKAACSIHPSSTISLVKSSTSSCDMFCNACAACGSAPGVAFIDTATMNLADGNTIGALETAAATTLDNNDIAMSASTISTSNDVSPMLNCMPSSLVHTLTLDDINLCRSLFQESEFVSNEVAPPALSTLSEPGVSMSQAKLTSMESGETATASCSYVKDNNILTVMPAMEVLGPGTQPLQNKRLSSRHGTVKRSYREASDSDCDDSGRAAPPLPGGTLLRAAG